MDIVKERLVQFAKHQEFMMMDFYKKILVAASNFSGDGANSALSTDKIVHILTIYPELSADWLLLGKGEMLRQDNTPNTNLYAAQIELVEKILNERDRRFEALTRENEKLRLENDALKSQSGKAGIIVQHNGGEITNNNNSDLLQFAVSLQQTMQELSEQSKALKQVIIKKL